MLGLADDVRSRLDDARELVDKDEADALTPLVREAAVLARLDGPDDHRPAVVLIHGSGRFAEMYAAGFPADGKPMSGMWIWTAGGCALVVTAPYAYGKLRHDAGTHHVLRHDGPDSIRTTVVEVFPLADEPVPRLRGPVSTREWPAMPGYTFRPPSVRFTQVPTGRWVHVDEGFHRGHALRVLRSIAEPDLPSPSGPVRTYDQGVSPQVIDELTGHRAATIGEVLRGGPGGFIAARLLR